jgi:hypothetical protein
MNRLEADAARAERDCRLLEGLVDQMGIVLRVEPCEGEGGLVSMGERRYLFVNRFLSAVGRREVEIAALRRLDLSGTFLSPRLRELLGDEGWTDELFDEAGKRRPST